MSSFSNVGFVPHDGENEEDAINLAPKSSESFPAEDSIFADGSPRHRTLFDSKKRFKLRPPLLASTPRVICRFQQASSGSSAPYFTREPTFQPIQEFIEMSEHFHDITENSQGYRFLNTKEPFSRHHSALHHPRLSFDVLPKVIDFSRRWIGRARDTLYRLSVAYSGQEELGIERARDELDDRREHINLSEIFGGSHSQENSCSSGGVFNLNFDKSIEDRQLSFENIDLDSTSPQSTNDVIWLRDMTTVSTISEPILHPSSKISFTSSSPSPQRNPKNEAQKNSSSKREETSMFRSDPMKLYQMILVKEAAFECVAEIGKHGNVQFVDLNAKMSLYSRTFVKQMRRCEEMERKLRFLEKQVITCKPGLDPKSIDYTDLSAPTQAEMIQLEHKLDQLEREFLDLNNNDYALRKNLNSSKEFLQVMRLVDEFFQVHKEEEAKARFERSATTDDIEMFSKSFGFGGLPSSNEMPLTPLLGSDDNAWFVAGVLPLDKKESFERVLWRACRRTAFVRTSDASFTVNDPVTLEPLQKCVFIVFFKGESLRLIVEKVCDGFNATQYPCPKSSKDRKMKMSETEGRMNDLTVVIDTTQTHRYTILKDMSFEIPIWLKNIQIQKSVFAVMNMFTVDTNGFLAGECWIPAAEEDDVRQALHDGFKASGTEVEPILNELWTNAPPPTFHRTNKFTNVFQSIVDSYGVSQYCEVNPAPYTIITFPFLFAVMFGDAAHGAILLLAALFFIRNERKIESKKIRDEIFNTFYGGRYIMMLMGIFSIYTGFLYNDAFAKSFNVFGSGWSNSYNETQLDWWIARSYRKHREYSLELVPEKSFDIEKTYPFGVDPIWNIADNRLSFLNSMKMKASVIIGITQMTFGVFLSVLNHIHFKSYIDIISNFIPQVIFLSCIFIYLCIQIIVKWIFFSVNAENVFGFEYPGSHCAPSLLIGLINMFMFKKRNEGYLNENGEVYSNCHLGYWYPNQRLVETILISISLACIPIMLFGKPLWVRFVTSKRHKLQENKSLKSLRRNGTTVSAPTSPVVDAGPPRFEDAELLLADELDIGEDIHHSLSDIFVHQAIHTIEFVLGCVSHTASYLRLWALSLAHAQLSEVMWHMVLIQGIHTVDHIENETIAMCLKPVVACVAFFIFASLSLSILIMMEGLSAFLHALRLHWVEFQSKFYLGTGHPFHAFYLKESLENAQLITEETDRLADISSGQHLHI
ncbi:V-type proton ATPase 116 kDa subunit a 4 [Caenorhabditis elegans]|uniref:V-type proton ATPase 116 kDa subunit a 4 n=2 Tax=Caenorhabditis elegans TaxID=6239 RepID=VPP4_CAEEL|nr:V-type proton ATPase 116 kDa subunit a 4 [Caenorhabditis elegans]B2MZD0.2 RecName: Full=V-type proton ATPase 116 kDa subunit a 4; Short=V-ATPase 116 kDa isoform a 4 [Caenorhabditis elegans]CAQ48388.2 V-type proton ATPase 116 kDa subunit a 4 [Caenorhabditis elegans]|eukprot:NP_001129847.2 V-type proton ATPase subunit a [Caenorhabditis elegans]